MLYDSNDSTKSLEKVPSDPYGKKHVRYAGEQRKIWAKEIETLLTAVIAAWMTCPFSPGVVNDSIMCPQQGNACSPPRCVGGYLQHGIMVPSSLMSKRRLLSLPFSLGCCWLDLQPIQLVG